MSTRKSDLPADDFYMTALEVLRRFKISQMTLWRWVKNEELGFPKPFVVNPGKNGQGRRLFLAADIFAFERDRHAHLGQNEPPPGPPATPPDGETAPSGSVLTGTWQSRI